MKDWYTLGQLNSLRLFLDKTNGGAMPYTTWDYSFRCSNGGAFMSKRRSIPPFCHVFYRDDYVMPASALEKFKHTTAKRLIVYIPAAEEAYWKKRYY